MFKFKRRFLVRKLNWDEWKEIQLKEAWDPSFISILVSNDDLFLQELIFFFLQLEKLHPLGEEGMNWLRILLNFLSAVSWFFTSLCSPLVYDYYWMLFDSWLPLHLKDVVFTLHKSLTLGLKNSSGIPSLTLLFFLPLLQIQFFLWCLER